MRDHARNVRDRSPATEDTMTRRTIHRWSVVVILSLLAAGCGRNAVRASEKEFLADQVMIFDEDGQEAAADEHVLNNREGSAGGRGARGGGCGCN
jgi:hypothetical protein